NVRRLPHVDDLLPSDKEVDATRHAALDRRGEDFIVLVRDGVIRLQHAGRDLGRQKGLRHLPLARLNVVLGRQGFDPSFRRLSRGERPGFSDAFALNKDATAAFAVGDEGCHAVDYPAKIPHCIGRTEGGSIPLSGTTIVRFYSPSLVLPLDGPKKKRPFPHSSRKIPAFMREDSMAYVRPYGQRQFGCEV